MTAILADMTSLDDLLVRQSGVVTTAQVRAHGSAGVARWKVDSDRWQRPARGVLVAHSGPLSPIQQLWVAVLRAGPGAVLAGRTAATLGGLTGCSAREIWLLIPSHRHVRGDIRDNAAVHLRAAGDLTEDDVHPLAAPPRTRMARSLIDAASWARTDDDARAIVAAGVQQGLVPVDRLLEHVQRRRHIRRRAMLLRTLRDISGGAHSLLELRFLDLCRRAGLPMPRLQAPRVDAHGRRRFVDAGWDDYAVVVEIDGAAHMVVRQWWADLDRQNGLVLGGSVVLRFPAHALHSRPDEVVAQVRRALEAAGWRPSR